MTAASWWAETLDAAGLSQGDILQELPFGCSPHPHIVLAKTTGKKGAETWVPTDQVPEQAHFLFKGRIARAVVLSHSCDLDKNETKNRIVVAPIRAMTTLTEEVRKEVLEQRRRALMPLPGIPNIGDCYADLRAIMSADRAFAGDVARVASMTGDGLKRLQAQIAVFFLRIDERDAAAPVPATE